MAQNQILREKASDRVLYQHFPADTEGQELLSVNVTPGSLLASVPGIYSPNTDIPFEK